jgi:hypothetical protein
MVQTHANKAHQDRAPPTWQAPPHDRLLHAEGEAALEPVPADVKTPRAGGNALGCVASMLSVLRLMYGTYTEAPPAATGAAAAGAGSRLMEGPGGRDGSSGRIVQAVRGVDHVADYRLAVQMWLPRDTNHNSRCVCTTCSWLSDAVTCLWSQLCSASSRSSRTPTMRQLFWTARLSMLDVCTLLGPVRVVQGPARPEAPRPQHGRLCRDDWVLCHILMGLQALPLVPQPSCGVQVRIGG